MNHKHERKHLTYEDRLFIQQNLEANASIHQIAKKLHKCDSSIQREIIRNRYEVKSKVHHHNPCARQNTCSIANLCDADCNRLCCANCIEVCCSDRCPDYLPVLCDRIRKAPHCCNGCPHWSTKTCNLVKYRYDAKRAQVVSDTVLCKSREGISLPPEKMEFLDNLVSPALLNCQSVHVVYMRNKEVMPCSERSLYYYIDKCLLTARNLDLPRKVRFRPKNHHKARGDANPEFAKERTYNDFKAYLEQHPEGSVCEMDTVIGKPGGKALLTLTFRSCKFMFAFLLEQDTQDCVIQALRGLQKALGAQRYRRLFGVILTDRGAEFRNTYAMEHDESGAVCSKVFYCDPYCSWQKGCCERNHEFIRMILPKGTSFDGLCQTDVTRMMSHINSYPRESLNDVSPYSLAEILLGKPMMKKLGFCSIPEEEILFRPSLLRYVRSRNRQVPAVE